MNNIKVVFFDLDHTLWDAKKNTDESLTELFYHYNLESLATIQLKDFLITYHVHNNYYWELFSQGKVDKHTLRTERFNKTLIHFNIDSKELESKISKNFSIRTPTKNHLIEGTFDILTYLSRSYDISIITNGFEETQYLKLEASKIDHFFKHVVTSDTIGFAKPNIEIFKYAAELHQENLENCLMIGDHLQIDVMAGIEAGMKGVWFNHDNLISEINVLSIQTLGELKNIL